MRNATLGSRAQATLVAWIGFTAMIGLQYFGLYEFTLIPAAMMSFYFNRLLTRHWTILAKEWEDQKYEWLREHPLAKSALKRAGCLCVAFICMAATFVTVKACLQHDTNVSDSSIPNLVSEPFGFFKNMDRMSWDWFVARLAKFFGSTRSVARHLILLTFCVVGSVIVLPPLKKKGENRVGKKEAC